MMQRPEQQIHKAVAQHLRLRGAPGLVWWHTANGGKRGVVEAAIFKTLGVRAGVSDIIALHDGKAYALELKAPKGRATQAQLEFLTDFKNAGGTTAIAEGIDAALSIIERWGLVSGSTVLSDLPRPCVANPPFAVV